MADTEVQTPAEGIEAISPAIAVAEDAVKAAVELAAAAVDPNPAPVFAPQGMTQPVCGQHGCSDPAHRPNALAELAHCAAWLTERATALLELPGCLPNGGAKSALFCAVNLLETAARSL